jgi:hypothetical protein
VGRSGFGNQQAGFGVFDLNAVSIGISPQSVAARGLPAKLVLLAIVDIDERLSQAVPGAVVRVVQSTGAGCVEHLRFSSPEQARGLPGLAGSSPSLLADSVRLALAAGCTYVDVVALSFEDDGRIAFSAPDMVGQLRSVLAGLPGAVLVAPDLRLGPAQSAAALVQDIYAVLPESFQILLLDAPLDAPATVLAEACRGLDVGVVRWMESPAAETQSFRSGATWVGARLCRPGAIGRSLTGVHAVPLPGRQMLRSREETLLIRERAAVRTSESASTIDLSVGTQGIQVLTEPSLRGTSDGWSLPALYAVKTVHRTLIEQASSFVFRNVNMQNAVAFGAGVSACLEPYVRTGLLSGIDGGMPSVEPAMIRDQSAPGLGVTVSAVLRPWTRRIHVQVGVAVGEAPRLRELA